MTEKEQIEILLKPRFEVIADYPNSNWSIGEIITDAGEFSTKHIYRKYPHLFREMKWWEKRTEEEMPRYVKLAPKGIPIGFFKVSQWSQWGEENRYIRVDNGNWEDTIGYLPATEAEYKWEGR